MLTFDQKRAVLVYNKTRETFVATEAVVADSYVRRLVGLLGKTQSWARLGTGLWIVPSRGVHTIGMLFAIDVIYLDAANRVIHLVEHMGPFRISPIRIRCASILELKSRSIYLSNTQIGDELLICAAKEMKRYCGVSRAEPAFRSATVAVE